MSFNPNEPLEGKYRIVSVAKNDESGTYTLTLHNWKSHKVITMNSKTIRFEGYRTLSDCTEKDLRSYILEVFKDGQFTTPIIRLPKEGELQEINNPPTYTPIPHETGENTKCDFRDDGDDRDCDKMFAR